MDPINQNKEQPDKLVYTVKEIANMLQISIRTAYSLCQRERGFQVVRIGKSIRINRNSFDQWFLRQSMED